MQLTEDSLGLSTVLQGLHDLIRGRVCTQKVLAGLQVCLLCGGKAKVKKRNFKKIKAEFFNF